MWKYEKMLQYPVNIKTKNIGFAKILITQIGGFAGELGAALRYLNQRYTMPTEEGKALLTEIGTEELAHIEVLSAMMIQLLKDATFDELKEHGLESLYTEHGYNFFPTDSFGVPFSTTLYAVSGDPIVDLTEDLAAEEKARIVYERLMDMTDDEDILKPLSFLRQREIIHFQRFGELLTHYNELKAKGQL